MCVLDLPPLLVAKDTFLSSLPLCLPRREKENCRTRSLMRYLTNLIRIFHVTFYHPVTPTMDTVEYMESCLPLAAFILGIVICNELETWDINHILIKSFNWASVRI